MVANRIIILSAVFAYTLAAPNGCIESCLFGTSDSSSFNSHQSSSSIQQQLQQSLQQLQHESHQEMQRLQQESQLNLDYSRPGNWTEHNQYNTDGGRGKVYEEHGQMVANDGSKRVRYHKKNFSTSSNSGNINVIQPSHLDSVISQNLAQDIQSQQQLYNQQSSNYNQHSMNYINSRSQRLEDLEDYHGTSQTNHGSYDTQAINRDNWQPIDSSVHGANGGGRGQVYEEHGQYVTGPKKVRYYKKNYSSSYSSSSGPSGVNVPIAVPTIPDVPTVQVPELRSNLQQVQRELDSFNREVNQFSNSRHVDASQLSRENVQLAGSRVRNSGEHHVNSYNQETVAGNSNYGHQVSQNLYRNPSDVVIDDRTLQTAQVQPAGTVYGSEKHSSYENHYAYTSGVHPTVQTSNYIRVPIAGRNTYQRNDRLTEQQRIEESRRAEALSTRQVQNEYVDRNINDGTYSNVYAQPTARGHTSQYHEEWSASSHSKGAVVPSQVIDSSQVRQHSRNHHNSHSSYESSHGAQAIQRSQSSHNAAYTSSSGQYSTGVNAGQVVDDADCLETQETQYRGNYRRYKRESKGVDAVSTLLPPEFEQRANRKSRYSHGLNREFSYHGYNRDKYANQRRHWRTYESDEDSSEENEKTEQRTVENDDHSQQTTRPDSYTKEAKPVSNEDSSEETVGHVEIHQQKQSTVQPVQEADDMIRADLDTQQTAGKFEFSQEAQPVPSSVSIASKDDHAQETLNSFGQQTQTPTLFRVDPILKNGDKFEKESGAIAKESQQPRALPHLTSIGNEELDDLNQQTTRHHEFGQQTQSPWNRNPADNQENQDLSQHTGGFDDFTQQTTGHLTLGQATQKPQWPYPSSDSQTLENQQTTGHFEFGQQTQSPWNGHLSDKQKNDDLSQQTGGFDDFSQQTTGHLTFGQATQKPQWPYPSSDSQKLENQQTTGHFEFGQQTQQSPWNRHPVDKKKNDDLSQQTGGFDDFSQQTTGHLTFGQATQKPQWPYPSSDNQKLENQQTNGHFEFGQQTQQSPWNEHPVDKQKNDDLSQQTGGFDDFSQQTTGHLTFGQATQKPQWSYPSSDNQKLENQQTNGHFEFGQQTQQSPWNGHPADKQKNDDLSQQTGGFDDLSQQTTEHEKPQFPHPISDNQKLENQQTTGHFEFGQQTQSPWNRNPVGNQEKEDLTQQTGKFEDFSQQTAGNFDFGQQTQKFDSFDNYNQQHQPNTPQSPYPKPAPKPKLKPRPSTDELQPYSNLKLIEESQKSLDSTIFDRNTDIISNQAETVGHKLHVKPNPVESNTDDIRRSNLQRGDQSSENPLHSNLTNLDNYYPVIEVTDNNSNQQSQNNSKYNTSQQNIDNKQITNQMNFHEGHKWHSTHHPSDLTNSEGAPNSYSSVPQIPSTYQVINSQNRQPAHVSQPGVKGGKHSGYYNSYRNGHNYEKQHGYLQQPQILENPSYQQSQVHNYQAHQIENQKPKEYQQVGNLEIHQNLRPSHQLQSQSQEHQKPYSEQAELHPSGHLYQQQSQVHNNENSQLTQQEHQHTGYSFQQQSQAQDHQNPQLVHQVNENIWNVYDRRHQKSYPVESEDQQRVSYQNTQIVDKETSHFAEQETEKLLLDHGQEQKAEIQNSESLQQENQHLKQEHEKLQPVEELYQQSQQYEIEQVQSSKNLELIQQDNKYNPSKIEQTTNDQINRDNNDKVEGSSDTTFSTRILQAYGGGPYVTNHHNDYYDKISPNPKATLPPYTNGQDPWDVREKIGERYIPFSDITVKPLDAQYSTAIPETPATTKKPSFWGRIGQSITNTYSKAKETAKDILSKI